MYQTTITASLLVLSLGHLLPLSGAVGTEKLAALYGVDIDDPNLEILMRHRAILFGLLGAFMMFAAFHREYQLLAFIGAFVSIMSYFWLIWSVGNFNVALKKIAIGDVVLLASLVIGSGCYYLEYVGDQSGLFT